MYRRRPDATVNDNFLFLPFLLGLVHGDSLEFLGEKTEKNIFFIFQLFINQRLVDSSPLKRALEMVYSAYLPKALN